MNSPRFVPRIPYRTMASRNTSSSSWAQTVNSPFTTTPCKIPDTQTNISGLVQTKLYTTFIPSALATNTTLHTGGFLITPHPNFLYTLIKEVAGGGLSMTDLAADGNSAISQLAAPNASAMSGGATSPTYRFRATSIGVRVTYEGTELNRAGRIVCGMLPAETPASGKAGSTQLSLLSTTTGSYATAYDTIRQSLQNIHISRVGDTAVEVSWRPFGVPIYAGDDSGGNALLPRVTVNGAAVQDSVYACSEGSMGLPYGSGILAVFVENDNISAAGLAGNNYGVEIVANWEVIPRNAYTIAYQLSPSPSDSAALSSAMNAISFRTTVLTSPFQNNPGRSQRRVASSPNPSTPRGVIRLKPNPSKTVNPPPTPTTRGFNQGRGSTKKADALTAALMGTLTMGNYLAPFLAHNLKRPKNSQMISAV